MTQEIIEMAKQAGDDWDSTLKADKDFLFRFAKLVAAKEREACAKICDKLQDDIATEPKHCASAIRARGEPTLRGEA